MLSSDSSWSVFEAACKNCGDKFTYSAAAKITEAARGLSAPARCPKCRRAIKRTIDSSGTCYWYPDVETDLTKREQARKAGKFGLRKLASNPPRPEEILYPGTPDPAFAQRFSLLDSAVTELIDNLVSPSGSKVSILVGPTGTGKSVWATYRMLQSRIGREGRICVSQPRLITLRAKADGTDDSTTPGFIAKKLLQAPGVGAGHEVGYRYRGEAQQQDRYTKLLFVTDGLLIRWILSGEIGKFSVVMIDEAHEQSANMELIFALMRYKLPLYPRLRLVIASATMDVDRFRNFFGNGDPSSVFVAAPSGELVSTPHQIHDRFPAGNIGYARKLPGFRVPNRPEDAPCAIAKIVRAIREDVGFTNLQNPRGDILAFLPTIKLVRDAAREISRLGIPELEVITCYADSPPEEYDKFRASEKRAERAFSEGRATTPQRVILATNYAETSVTISNLVYVIDSGWIMEPVWNSEASSMDYPVRRHSQAGCTQRKGRVGRVQPGEVFRLYAEAEFHDGSTFRPTVLPEIARAPLDKFLLAAKACGIEDLDSFKWLGYDGSKQQNKERKRALAALKRAGALDEDADLTNRGVELEGLEPKFVDHALLLSESDAFGCSLEVATLLSFVSAGRKLFLENEQELVSYDRWRSGCYDDLDFYLRIYFHWEEAGKSADEKAHAKWSRSQGLNHNVLKNVAKLRQDALRPFTMRTHTDATARALDLERLHRVRFVVARSLPEWLYVRDQKSAGMKYRPHQLGKCPCRESVAIDRESACLADSGVEAFVSLGRELRGETLFAKYIIRVKTEWIRALSEVGPAAAAFTISKAVTNEDRAQALASKQAVATLPSYTLVTNFTPRLHYDFTVVRTTSVDESSGEDLVLVRTADGYPALLRLDYSGDLLPGMVFRAQVVSADARSGVVSASRKAVSDSFVRGSEITCPIVKELISDSDNRRYGFLLELCPGVFGRLLLRSFGKRYGTGSFLYVGQTLTLTVESNDNGQVSLAAANYKLNIGQAYFAVVSGFLEGKGDYARAGVFAEFLPFREGLIHHTDIREKTLNSLKEGESIVVTLLNVDTSGPKVRYRLRYERRNK
jgi:HrpA-like RNA helicase